MPQGTVKFFNAAKGFGFITSDEDSKDIFVPAASVTAAGVAVLKPGQRVAFETVPDKKGAKAIDLKILAPVPAPKPVKPVAAAPASEASRPVTLYVDPDDDAAGDVLAELRRAGHEPVIIDYIASPPTKEELKRLSLLLRDSDQSLVRKYDHLFIELRLDDRFIGDSEYWSAISEHPSLINGPVVAMATRASICHSAVAVKSFLSAPKPGETPPAAPRKGLSPGLLRLINGGGAPPPKPAPVEKPQAKVAAPAEKPKLAVKPKPDAKPKAKAKAVSKAKPAPKPKAKPAPKTAAQKPAKKR